MATDIDQPTLAVVPAGWTVSRPGSPTPPTDATTTRTAIGGHRRASVPSLELVPDLMTIQPSGRRLSGHTQLEDVHGGGAGLEQRSDRTRPTERDAGTATHGCGWALDRDVRMRHQAPADPEREHHRAADDWFGPTCSRPEDEGDRERESDRE